jgi:hypothetical protein
MPANLSILMPLSLILWVFQHIDDNILTQHKISVAEAHMFLTEFLPRYCATGSLHDAFSQVFRDSNNQVRGFFGLSDSNSFWVTGRVSELHCDGSARRALVILFHFLHPHILFSFLQIPIQCWEKIEKKIKGTNRSLCSWRKFFKKVEKSN